MNKNYIKAKCVNCGKEIEKYKFNTGNSFCKRPSYCRYEYLHKIRDPKGYAIMNHINDPDFYYLLGLICTDGNITYPREGVNWDIGYSCYINLNKKDKKLIKTIENKFGGNSQLMNDNTIRWKLTNKIFIDYLLSIGITHNKSSTLNVNNWFNSLTLENKIHYLRGIIDGDGSIKKFKNNRTFNICTGSKSFYKTIKQFLLTITSIGISEEHHPTYSYIKYNNINMLKILDLVYSNIDDKIYMDRKYKEYLKIKEFYKNYNKIRDYRYRKIS